MDLLNNTNYGFVGAMASIVVALLSVLFWLHPGALGRRVAGWVIAAAVARALADAQNLLPVTYTLRGLAQELSPQSGLIFASLMMLAEAARVAITAMGRRSRSPWWHLLLVPALVGLTAWPVLSAVPILEDILYSLLFPATLLGLLLASGYAIIASGFSLQAEKHGVRAWALRFAIWGLVMADLASIMTAPNPIGAATLAFLVVAGAGFVTALLLQPGFGNRVTLGLAVFCAVAFLALPFVAQWNARRAETELRRGWLVQVRAAAITLSGSPAVAELGTPETAGAVLAGALEVNLHNARRDYAQRDSFVWVPGNGQVRRLEPDLAKGSVKIAPGRRLLPGELRQVAEAKPFLLTATKITDGGFVAVHAPVFGKDRRQPLAWFTLEYPAAVWTGRIDSARWTGGLLAGLCSAFAAAALALVCRQIIEGDRQVKLERAEAADRAKSEFLAFLSHELRTPMQTVLGRAELLRHGGVTPEQAKQVDAIEGEGRLLLRLVTDLLDLGTIDAGRLKLQPADISLRKMLGGLVESHRGHADAKGLAVSLEIAPDVPEAVHADEARLRQVLGNVLGNAIKYTEQGEVRLGVLCEGGAPAGQVALRFSITDTGSGLPPEQIDRLFNLFTRLDSSATFRREGTGVGLALVKRLTEFMGGSVAAANRPEGGAQFTVRLRFAVAHPPVTPRVAAAVPAAASFASAAGRHALVVDDNPAVRDWLRDALVILGFAVETVKDGDAALAAAGRQHFNVIVIDVNMPGRDGMSVARELRARWPGLRIVGCSAEAFAATRTAALTAGMDAFLTKPVSLSELAQAVGQSNATPPSGDLFARLQSSDTTAQVQARLREEWPRLRGQAEAALAAGDCDALRRLGHYLKSTALLANDAALGEVCERLSAAIPANQRVTGGTLLAEVDKLVAAWPLTRT